jgi:hypothetical protein
MVHACKSTNVCKDILKGVEELEGVNIAKPVLDMGIDTRKDILKGICELEGVNIAEPVLDMGINARKDVLKGIRELEGVNIAKPVLDMGINVCKDILKGIRELKGVDIAKSVLDIGINDKLCQAQNFLTQVGSVPKTRLLLLFCGQRPIKPIINKKQCQRIEITHFTGFNFIL